MKYFLDSEFLEGPQKEPFPLSLFRKETKPTIDLISIALVGEDGREYYAISKEFNLKEAWNRWEAKKDQSINDKDQKEYWIRENVLKPIYLDLLKMEDLEFGIERDICIIGEMDFKEFKFLINRYGKTNSQIAKEIKKFVGTKDTIGNWNEIKDRMKTEFWGYFSDYDWVGFCWLFGKMIDLPEGFPYYCRDLKQEMDNYIKKTRKEVEMSTWGHEGISLSDLKASPSYPQQDNEHNALSDARWNFELYKFLQTL